MKALWQSSVFRRTALVLLAVLLLAILVVGQSVLPAQAQGTNLALNRPVTCSPSPQFPCAEAVDGNLGTRWASAQGVDPQWIYVDLGATYSLTSVTLRWETAYARAFQIQVSGNASTWTTLYSTTTSTGGIQNLTVSGSGRYVRMYGTVRATGYGYSLWEFQVYGGGTPPPTTPPPTTPPPTTPPPTTPPPTTPPPTTPPPSGNLALGRPVTCSSIENAGTPCASAVDGNTGTRWASAFSDPQWITVDLGATYTINRVVLLWEAAYGRSYQIQVSTNASTWSTIYSTTTGDGGTDDLAVSGSGRYVRMYGTVRATGWGYSLWELQVYSGATPPPTTPPPTTPPPTTPPPTTPPPTTPPPGPVDFGPNVHIFDPSMSSASIQNVINSVYSAQQPNHFGDRRDALVFKPGSYNVDLPIGFYTQILGLGASPNDVYITGYMHSDAYLPNFNSTQNFWRGAEGFSVTSSGGFVRWGVSQAAPLRRMHIRGYEIALHDNYGWASGGWMSDVLVDGHVNAGSQQQWISRNSQWATWGGSVWNMVFVGSVNAPADSWPNPTMTTIAQTPIVREKPFLQIDGAGNYSVRVPSIRTNSSGISWAGGSTPGTTIPISEFYIAKSGVDTAATINAQLAAGKNLILAPGVYGLNDTIRVTRPNTVVLGLGFATLRANTGLPAMTVADVDGVIVAGLFFDAGIINSPVLLEVGPSGSSANHAANPISLHDVFFRVGGAAAGKATVSLRVNSNNTIIDHTWIWRADHGTGVGWTSNPGANGLVVNGNNVTAYGLFVEHYQEYQVLWNGNGGRTYFYQSELPYDPPNQASWTSGSGINGWASYKVANNVTSHEAYGMGIYAVFTNAGIWQTRAIETPVNSNVRFRHLVTVNLTANGGISNVINNVGGATLPSVGNTPKVESYP